MILLINIYCIDELPYKQPRTINTLSKLYHKIIWKYIIIILLTQPPEKEYQVSILGYRQHKALRGGRKQEINVLLLIYIIEAAQNYLKYPKLSKKAS